MKLLKASVLTGAFLTVFSLMRSISVPLGISDPEKPNIASTLWRTVSDTRANRYYFESTYSPSVFWVDLDKLDLSVGEKPSKLSLKNNPLFSGEVSAKFIAAEPFSYLAY